MCTYTMQNWIIGQVRQLCLISQFQHVVKFLCFFLKRLHDRKPYHLSSETWALLLQPLKVKWIFNVCGPLYTRTSFLWFFNPIIFVSSYFKNNQDNEVISEEALNKASQARLIPFFVKPDNRTGTTTALGALFRSSWVCRAHFETQIFPIVTEFLAPGKQWFVFVLFLT